MKAMCAVALAAALLPLTAAPAVFAAERCPAEVIEAKSMLAKATTAATKAKARGQETQAPRHLAGARPQDVQAPRSQDVQAPRGQDVQAPRGQDVQAPRGQDVQAPRAQDVQAPRLSKARKLVREAEAACKKGDMALSASKAREAIQLLK